MINLYQYCIQTQSNIWAIGDVHGCIDEYFELIDKIKEIDQDAHIVQLGDMIDRGPAFEELILNDSAHTKIMGNHEFNFLQEVYGKPCRSNAREVTHNRFKSLSSSVQDEVLVKIKERLPVAVHENTTFCHSIPNDLREFNIIGRSYPFFSTRSESLKEHEYRYLVDGCNLYHGHQHWNFKEFSEQIEEGNGIFNLDSGVVYGNKLIAVRISDKMCLEVKAKQVYSS